MSFIGPAQWSFAVKALDQLRPDEYGVGIGDAAAAAAALVRLHGSPVTVKITTSILTIF